MRGLQIACGALFLIVAASALVAGSGSARAAERPNVLFCIADDWGWPHAGAYGDPVVKTPAFDRLAREGVLFEHAFVTSPSCTPSRNSILTGQWHARLGQGVNLWSTLDPKHACYPLLLEDAGYHVGHWRKSWGPGDWTALGRTRHPAGPVTKGFGEFLAARPKDKPFCFWLGSSDPHRPYVWQSGAKNGIDPAKVRVPADLPDHETVRQDVADYYFEVQRFDSDVAAALKLLDEQGLAEDTLVVMTGDHGMPFPRHKCHLYDSGTHVPLAARWPRRVPAGRRVTDFVSLADLAPTFLEATGVEIPAETTGRSLLPVLVSKAEGRVDAARDHVLVGRERHVPVQEKPDSGGYPMRAIRTDRWLYIRNFKPDGWPSGSPDPAKAFSGRLLGDCDDGPTKVLLHEHRNEEPFKRFYDLAFAKRPAEELYDLSADPDQLTNVADKPDLASTKQALATRMTDELRALHDPRIVGGAEGFDRWPYRGRKP